MSMIEVRLHEECAAFFAHPVACFYFHKGYADVETKIEAFCKEFIQIRKSFIDAPERKIAELVVTLNRYVTGDYLVCLMWKHSIECGNKDFALVKVFSVMGDDMVG